MENLYFTTAFFLYNSLSRLGSVGWYSSNCLIVAGTSDLFDVLATRNKPATSMRVYIYIVETFRHSFVTHLFFLARGAIVLVEFCLAIVLNVLSRALITR